MKTAGTPAWPSPAAGAAVMSTGILSTATQLAGLRLLSWALLALAVLGEVVLAAGLAARLLSDREGVVIDAGTPASLTGVAATAVIGARVVPLGWTEVAWALAAAGALLWLLLMPLVLWHWHVPTIGAGFLVCVATEGLAVLGATLGAATGDRPVVAAGFLAFLLGLILYVVVVTRFDWRQLAVGTGDEWVLAGAMAITSLAAAELARANALLGLLPHVQEPLRLVDLAMWAASVIGYGLLIGYEVRWPRWHYDVHRWATVFPMGMAAAATFAAARTERLVGLTVLGHVLFWPGLAAWVLTAVGAARQWLRLHDTGP